MAGTANAVNGPEAAPYLAKAGGTMTGNLILNGSPSTSLQAATKGYVDNVVLNTLTACLCASTTALTVTYANGSSGVGATLTNAGAMAAFSVDGVSPAVNDRVLIKDQASGLQNGIYTVTTVGSGAVNWVLTRATDYDEAADMQAGDKVAVVSGTTQAATEWMMTQTAAITVGVTSITWAEMGQVTASITSVVQQIFTATGTYTPTTGMIYCIIEAVGGGGGSGATTSASGANSAASGAGGAGGWSKGVYTAATIKGAGTVAAITVGTGGAGGAAGANSGSPGNNTTVVANNGAGATLMTCNGGSGGSFMTSTGGTDRTNGGAGGSASGGSLNVTGNAGWPGIVAGGVALPAYGGASYYGGVSRVTVNSAGVAAAGYGSGGTGVWDQGVGTDLAGGAGSDGVVYITEFVSTSA